MRNCVLHAGDCEWCPHLPERLKKLHSHWLCRPENVVLFRGTAYHERSVSFILRLLPSLHGEKTFSGQLLEVPAKIGRLGAQMTVRAHSSSSLPSKRKS